MFTKCWYIIVKAIDFFLDLFHISLNEQKRKAFFQFVQFAIIGLSGTIVGYLLYLLVLFILHASNMLLRIDYILANIISWVLGVLWNFYWNRKYAFSSDSSEIHWLKALIKFYASYAFTGLILTNLLSVFWVEKIGMTKIVVPILNLFVSVPINYLLTKYWTFRSRSR